MADAQLLSLDDVQGTVIEGAALVQGFVPTSSNKGRAGTSTRGTLMPSMVLLLPGYISLPVTQPPL